MANFTFENLGSFELIDFHAEEGEVLSTGEALVFTEIRKVRALEYCGDALQQTNASLEQIAAALTKIAEFTDCEKGAKSN